ncbi:MAG TPA: TspO/MBR family protein [Methylibium sp.]|uniref:TspO/MBR family protein n=1 Tax=Methylibium sp. TaxID=2067992 RepID=UPI002DBA596F|nr:TspO/MBR family protein [Methylibium sp.]HEU4457691.1 TspO/MBR family protein [Methylibium sp.]
MSLAAASRRKAIVGAALAAVAVAVLGGLATDIGPWYQALKKPSWQPPDWLFGPVWTVIFALTALAGLKAAIAAPDAAARRTIVKVFGANAALNVLWSLLFFRLHRPDWALAEVVVLWLSIVVLIVVVARHSALGAWLLVPYLGWVAFAAFLNYTIVALNGPFGAPMVAGGIAR